MSLVPVLAVWLAMGQAPARPAPAPAVLDGVVRSVDGLPVPGARVVVREPGVQPVVTDSTGAFHVAGVTLPATVVVTAKGFAPATRDVSTSPADVVLDLASVVESVVVAPNRTEAWRDPAMGATVLDRADLDRLPAVTLDESLRAISGFSLYRRSSSVSANPTTDGVTMRGLSASGASRGLVLLDGVPLNDGFGGWVTWTRLPELAVSRVDIERGSEGDAYGSDALGGVIRILTPSVEHTMAAIGGSAGSDGVAELDLAGGERRGRVDFFGATTGFETDGTIPVAPESRGVVDTPTDATWTNGMGRVDLAGTDRRLAVEGWASRDDRGNGTVLQRNRMTGGTGAVTFDAAGGATTIAARASYSPNDFYQTFSTVAANRATEKLTSTQTTDTGTARATVELGRIIPRGRVLVVGAATRDVATFTNVTPSASTTEPLRDDTEAVATELSLVPAASLSVSAGARGEWRAAPTDDAPHDDAVVGHVAAVWQAAPSVSFHTSVATSHRWPTLNELVRNFQSGNVLTLANPLLGPEESRSFDGSVEISRAWWMVSTAGFHDVVHNAVANVTQPSGTVPGFSGIVRERENAGDADATGAEIDGELRSGATLRLRGSVTALRAVFLHSLEPALEGNRLPQVPKVSASLSGDALVGHRVTASFVWHAVSSQFDDDLNTFLLAAAYQLDVRASARWAGVEWSAVATNVTNSRIETALTPVVSLAPGREFRIGVVWKR